MLIGIDASRAIGPTPTGTESYSRELIRALVSLDHRNTYRLYTRQVDGAASARLHPSAEIRAIPFPRLWTHARLSAEMIAHPPDLLFVPAHVIPLVHPARSVVTVHDLGHRYFPEAYPKFQRLYHNWSTAWNCRNAWHILTDSEATRDDVGKFHHVPGDRITVVYPALADNRKQKADIGRMAEVKSRYGLSRDYIVSIGTIQPRKNYSRLIDAFAQLRARQKNCVLDLVIVGRKGWLYKGILARVQTLGLENSVRFLDYVSDGDLPIIMASARLLAFPSLYEGFGIPVLEAQACGIPVICSMTSSLPEVAGDGALFVDPYDVDALSAAMERLLGDEPLRVKLTANGLKNLERFSWEASARRVLNVFEMASHG